MKDPKGSMSVSEVYAITTVTQDLASPDPLDPPIATAFESASVDVAGYGDVLVIFQAGEGFGGATAAEVDVKVQTSSNDTDWVDLDSASFATIDAAGIHYATVQSVNSRRYLRLLITLTGGVAGTAEVIDPPAAEVPAVPAEVSFGAIFIRCNATDSGLSSGFEFNV